MSFKLLAIRPLKGCSARFLKNLEEDRIYKFYNDYSFFENQDGKVTEIKCEDSVPENLYEKSGLDIQISALVGKNGSGKSSLLELLYASCYVIAISQKILYDEMVDVEGLKVAIFYNIGNNYYEIEITNSEVKCYNINDETKTTKENDEVLKDFFFYTIAVNYSLYGLNEKVLGNWISALFHKNDGYQTPLVINPYRREGNINVNSELHLAQTRLITNILLTDNKEILSGKEIDSVCFELDSKKYKDKKEKENIIVESSKATFDEIYEKLYKENHILEKDKEKENPHFEDLMNYILCKIKKISEVYKEYRDIAPFEGNKVSQKFLEKLVDDKSHITLKLRQVLNIIRFNLLEDKDSKWEEKENGVLHFKLKIDDFIKRIKEVNTSNPKKDELIPIGCYRFIINVKNDTKNNDSVSNINVMSSGEQHLVHTMQSVLYHILNVNSVHNSKESKNKYEYINIIFDEIELYFHPEYQRRFVFELLERLDSLKKGNHIPKIKGINILFCTHSPFILSDIPKQNVLFLGEKKDFKTFGANITTLLANSFFMENLIGEFAKNKINEVIRWITQDKEDILKTIKLIDEPILRNKLIEMYYEKFPDKEREKSEEKIRALAEQLGIEIEIKQNK
ncbi:AAA family ATPase [Capnocytophaga gingivalis]|uniref:AAA family ATPase n=1 Tax=Capnocytophaga gingivalis TaxID=1017 RepID=A0ABU5YD66_9FLAO|nr:AAA family ATPase [Capnocytophaga gingivalis]MEB3041897.1 AAA family ATPase [Capnocytophaga gingivalis]